MAVTFIKPFRTAFPDTTLRAGEMAVINVCQRKEEENEKGKGDEGN